MTFSHDELSDLASFAERLADAARAQTLPRFRREPTIFNKAGPWFDPVTDADREAERVQREMIARVYPDHGVIGEEFGASEGASPWRWVLDPVDGTRAFVCGAATWATLIALEYEGVPVMGVIDQPFTDEHWIGFGGSTTYRRDGESHNCSTSGVTEIDKARITTTDPRPTAYFDDAAAEKFARLSDAARLTRFGYDAYGYALLALGEIDVVAESGLHHHDYAALIPVIEGAGGVATDWRGEPVWSTDAGEVLAAATPELHQAALDILNA